MRMSEPHSVNDFGAISIMLQGHSTVFQALRGTFFTWGMTAAGAALVFVFSSGQTAPSPHHLHSTEADLGWTPWFCRRGPQDKGLPVQCLLTADPNYQESCHKKWGWPDEG
ncbi:uncharacterized protein LOC106026489 isoform X2 [Cavia porcellus]|uniref:uncharacterized protein LOC106026489 isoform X2 n=1 Tax=Cavia porcellus TaxID=10141 RepID=UPI002FE3F1BF